MMMHEFTERTGYTPTNEEYVYIEDSYYEFPGNKDEFCKAWMKDKKSGAWDKEMKLRKAMYDQREEFNKKIAEQEENLVFYRQQMDEYRALREAVKNAGATVKIKAKGQKTTHHNATVKYIDNGTVKFLRIEENGWVTCYRVEEIEKFEVR